MNGIIFHDTSAKIGCAAEFIFEPDLTGQPEQAIAKFSTGEKAYAQISRNTAYELNVRIGEYLSSKGKKVSEKVWKLIYNQNKKVWKVVRNLD
ncbi:hypothetical protein [Sphingobacterium sp.]|uniref:hypothetical protein n=1 Tax=Sphingobacterium sp. TaxID=341027 RepID=UPI00289C04A9|nr:hypothetical protein [Sphingobacterium sp.]